MTRMQRVMAIASIVAVLGVTVLGSGPALAQTDGEGVVWAFAQEEPFFDGRVATAFASLVAASLTETGAPAATAVRPEPDGGVVPLPGAPLDQVPLLFAASGYPEAGFEVIGPCRYWAAVGSEDAGAQVAAAFDAVLADLEVEAGPCTVIADPAEAHLLIWAGATAPAIPSRAAPTFLTGSNVQSLSPPPQPGGAGGTDSSPQPPATGMGRAAADETDRLPLWSVVLLTGSLAIAARRVTGRSRA